MLASGLAKLANEITDENHDFSVLKEFINDGIAEINVELNAKFPFITDDVEIAFPEEWQRTVLVPFVAARIKQKDSSQFEYTDLYHQFQVNLGRFQSKYTVPNDYKNNEMQDSFPPDYTGNPYTWG